METSPPRFQVHENGPPHLGPQSNRHWLWTETDEVMSPNKQSFIHVTLSHWTEKEHRGQSLAILEMVSSLLQP